jgi:hypothetical protein
MIEENNSPEKPLNDLSDDITENMGYRSVWN